MGDLLKIAANELGTKEISGSEHNATIVGYAQAAGFTWVNDDETAWCSIFVNWVAMQAELPRSEKANARSWLTVGEDVTNAPEPGDVVVFWRESPASWKGHVALFLGFSSDKKMVFCLGGNQGNSVSIAAYPASTVLGFRKLTHKKLTQVPEKTLRKGDRGNDVRALQEALILARFSSGTVDGDFGSQTESAVKALQALHTQLTIDGVFGPDTRTHLISILNQ